VGDVLAEQGIGCAKRARVREAKHRRPIGRRRQAQDERKEGAHRRDDCVDHPQEIGVIAQPLREAPEVGPQALPLVHAPALGTAGESPSQADVERQDAGEAQRRDEKERKLGEQHRRVHPAVAEAVEPEPVGVVANGQRREQE
jgi:hypothetical protein